jgi:hypothetical protein
MGFADNYLQKHATGEPLIPSAPDPALHSIIAIPAYNESRLITCLDSLYACTPPEVPAEVIVLINSGEQTPRSIVDLNRHVHRETTDWINVRKRPGLTFHVVLIENLPARHFGAGLARKLVMDEAVRRFNQVDHAAGIILSLDADTLVEQNYLRAVTGFFDRAPDMDGCSIRFAHPVEAAEETLAAVSMTRRESEKASDAPRPGEQKNIGSDRESGDEPLANPLSEISRDRDSKNEPLPGYQSGAYGDESATGGMDARSEDQQPGAVYRAIVNYELHQRYYLEAVRYTGYPYAFHTVGSAFAVRAGAYCRQGGMSKRQAGEDFYFIQKVAMQGNYSECNTTTVHPSPRPSDRVPFGTGPAIAQQLAKPGAPFLTYAPQLFRHLHDFYALIAGFFANGPIQTMLHSLHPMLRDYLDATGFLPALAEIRRNVASEPAFRQRFYRKFNMFWILKYLHFAGEQGVKKVEIGAAAREMLAMKAEMLNRKDAQGNTPEKIQEKKKPADNRKDAQRNTAKEIQEMPGRDIPVNTSLGELLSIYRICNPG